MAKVTISINADLEEKIRIKAKERDIPLSKFIVMILEQQFNNQWHPQTKQLAGSWQDFADLDEIRMTTGKDIKHDF